MIGVEMVDEIQKIGAAAVAAVVGGFAVLFKLRRVATNDNKETTSDAATTDVIGMLREEVRRLSQQNSKLSNIVHALQLQMIDLHKENYSLRTDIARIKDARKTS